MRTSPVCVFAVSATCVPGPGCCARHAGSIAASAIAAPMQVVERARRVMKRTGRMRCRVMVHCRGCGLQTPRHPGRAHSARVVPDFHRSGLGDVRNHCRPPAPKRHGDDCRQALPGPWRDRWPPGLRGGHGRIGRNAEGARTIRPDAAACRRSRCRVGVSCRFLVARRSASGIRLGRRTLSTRQEQLNRRRDPQRYPAACNSKSSA
jgi:hypothetical protein